MVSEGNDMSLFAVVANKNPWFCHDGLMTAVLSSLLCLMI